MNHFTSVALRDYFLAACNLVMRPIRLGWSRKFQRSLYWRARDERKGEASLRTTLLAGHRLSQMHTANLEIDEVKTEAKLRSANGRQYTDTQ
jgi:hypothetical protein